MTRRLALKDRFESFFKIGSEKECWLWRGAISGRGYGRFNAGNTNKFAHRIAWEIYCGPIGGSYVLHRCDNPPCVNPSHLFLGTHADNMRDMVAKNRTSLKNGASNPNSKLSVADVHEVRRLRSNCRWTLQRIADVYNVTTSTIYAIEKGLTWQR
jgi:DNA-binding XRE family transcriptional regulator